MGHQASTTVSPAKARPGPVTSEEELISPLALVPSYGLLFRDTQTTIFSESGPLPIPTRHFIALMASRATSCTALTRLEEELFISSGGARSWLKEAPTKVKKLEEINLLLCSNPRLLTTNHIKKLTDGDESFSITEVVQALVILIHSHGLSSFLKSLGKDQPSQGRLQKITERKSIEFLDIVDKSLDQQAWKNVQKELKRKRSFSEGEISTNYQSKVSQNSKRQAALPAVERVDAKLTGDIRIQDYSWDDQGFSVLSTFYHDLAVILDDKFRTAKCIVKQTEKNSKLNRAVWSYVQSLLGVHYDDYNYQEIEEVLDSTSKDYIKMCCGQTKLRPSLAQTLFAVLPHTDLVQLSVIVMEARNLSEILFVLKSVMKYMS